MRFLMMCLLPVLMLFGSLTATASNISNKGIQQQEYVYDFAVDGGATGFINLADNFALPVGSVIVDVYYYVETAMTSGGSATVAIGDADTAARYLAATAFDNAAYADEKVAKAAIGVPFKTDSANDGKFGITIATAALTAGKIRFFVNFLQHK